MGDCKKKNCESKCSAQQRCGGSLPELESKTIIIKKPSLLSRLLSLLGL